MKLKGCSRIPADGKMCFVNDEEMCHALLSGMEWEDVMTSQYEDGIQRTEKSTPLLCKRNRRQHDFFGQSSESEIGA